MTQKSLTSIVYTFILKCISTNNRWPKLDLLITKLLSFETWALSSNLLLYSATMALLLALNVSFSIFSTSRSKDFSRTLRFLLALFSSWSAKCFACSAALRLSKTVNYDAFDFSFELQLRVRTEGWQWTEITEWTERFDFAFIFYC